MAMMCPHCGSIMERGVFGLSPIHGEPRCPGSQQVLRCAESDGRPLWNGKANPHFYRNQEA